MIIAGFSNARKLSPRVAGSFTGVLMAFSLIATPIFGQTPAPPPSPAPTPAAQAKAQNLQKLKDLGKKALGDATNIPAAGGSNSPLPDQAATAQSGNTASPSSILGALGSLGGGSTKPGTTALSQRDAESGMRQALSLGVDAVTARLGRVDGFFKDSKVRIPLPGSFAKIQSSLRPIGGAKILNDLELAMNRAAEAAMPQAKILFADAIRNMSAENAIAIVRGGPSAATDYLKSQTQTKLVAAFQPIMEQNLEKSGAFQALAASSKKYGAPDLSGTARANLSQFAVTKALDGMFYYVGEEEAAIRANPAKQTTALLKTIFGQIAGQKSTTIP